MSPSGPSFAQGKEVRFLSWGGTVQTMLEKEGWADKIQEGVPGYSVVLVPKATSAEGVADRASAVAQKASPQVDVVMCDL